MTILDSLRAATCSLRFWRSFAPQSRIRDAIIIAGTVSQHLVFLLFRLHYWLHHSSRRRTIVPVALRSEENSCRDLRDMDIIKVFLFNYSFCIFMQDIHSVDQNSLTDSVLGWAPIYSTHPSSHLPQPCRPVHFGMLQCICVSYFARPEASPIPPGTSQFCCT